MTIVKQADSYRGITRVTAVSSTKLVRKMFVALLKSLYLVPLGQVDIKKTGTDQACHGMYKTAFLKRRTLESV